jgi:hypothetical protein
MRDRSSRVFALLARKLLAFMEFASFSKDGDGAGDVEPAEALPALRLLAALAGVFLTLSDPP